MTPTRSRRASGVTVGQIAFAIGMVASGVLNLINRDFYSPWLPVPAWVPARALFAFTLVFLVLLKTPPLLREPQIELHWLDYGQIAVLVAGALTLATTNETLLRAARFLLGAALVPIGLSHFFYLKIATPMVPAVLPFREAWVIFTGTAHIAAGVAILAGILGRLAAILEAIMLTAFAVLVWVAPLLAAPHDINLWVEPVVTVAVANGVWAVASKMTATSAP